MRFRIYFRGGIHPPIEIGCQEGDLLVQDEKHLRADAVEMSFTVEMSLISDNHGRQVWPRMKAAADVEPQA